MGKASKRKKTAKEINESAGGSESSNKFIEKRSVNIVLFIVALSMIVLPLALTVLKASTDPAVPFLAPVKEAQWIHLKRPFHLGIWRDDEVISYRRQFTVRQEIALAKLTVRALRSAQVYLDGRLIMPFSPIENWKHFSSLDLQGLLAPGTHELRVIVRNKNGPAVLNAFSKELAISTGPEWEASIDGVTWGPTTPVGERGPLALAERFPSTFTSFRDLFPFHMTVFAISFALILSFRSDAKHWLVTPPMVRWLMVGALGLLAANNISKVPLHVGFDVQGHYDYISYITNKGRIPLATEGWQMFQSPLYYLLSAALQLMLSNLFSAETVAFILRVIPLASGVLQVELAYRAVRYVFPERADLQMMGTMIGGLLPMNLYISQVVGNEPLAGVLSAGVIVMGLGLLYSVTSPIPRRKVVLLGAVLGLAVLTKVTAAVLIPITLIVLIYVMIRRETPVKLVVGAVLSVLIIVIVVSGWYYLRNWIELGRPFVGGWDPVRQIVWWQDPGYRTISDFVSFGRSLSQPVFSAIFGFWDAVYSTFWLDGFLSSIISYKHRPPWNYRFMLSGALLSLLPAMGILFGFVRAVAMRKGTRPGQLMSAYCIALFYSVLLSLYLAVPIYSTAKATYTVGLIPCYAILSVTGLDILAKNRYLGAALKALLICWAVTVYFSYFVV